MTRQAQSKAPDTQNILQFMAAKADAQPQSMIDRALDVMRWHLKMDVAYINELEGDHTVARYVSVDPGKPHPVIGQPTPADEGYCKAMLDGRLPGLIQDTARVPFTQTLPPTHTFPVRAYVAAPVRLPDGRLYGTFCCASSQPDESLNNRDHAMLKAFSDLAAYQIGQDLESGLAVREATERVTRILETPATLDIVLQPIWDIQRGRPFAVEALARFETEPYRAPDIWFADAGTAGLRAELELLAIDRALATLDLVPEALSVSINVSPDTVLRPDFAAMLDRKPLGRLILELTEHCPISDYPAVREAIAPLRRKGLSLAVDDAGGGYASLSHILQLNPDVIKSDMALTRNIHRDRAAQSLSSALVGFARATSARLIAEGVENEKELFQLQRLGMQLAQGYHLGRPVPPARLPETLSRGAAAVYPAPGNVAGVRLEPETGCFYEPRSRSVINAPVNDASPPDREPAAAA